MQWRRFFTWGSISFVLFLISIFLSNETSLKAMGEEMPPYVFLQKSDAVTVKEADGALVIETRSGPFTEIQFSGQDIVRFAAQTEARISLDGGRVKVLLFKGSLWLSRFHGSPEILVESGNITVLPGIGSGAVESEGPLVQASETPLFIEESGEQKIVYPFESSAENSLVANDIEGELCSPEGCKNIHPWFSQNEKLDQALLEKKQQDMVKAIEARGANFLAIPSLQYRAEKFFLGVRNFFSFRDDETLDSLQEISRMLLDDVFYFAFVNQPKEADSRFSLASKTAYLLPKDSLRNFWERAYREFAWMPHDNPFVSFRDALRYELMKQGDNEKISLSFDGMRDMWETVSENDPVLFLSAVKKYEAEVDNFFPASTSRNEKLLDFYRVQIPLFQYLFRKYEPKTLAPEFLETLSFFESRFINQLEGQEKQKAVGEILEGKIAILKRIAKQFEKNESFTVLQKAAIELVRESEKLAVTLPPDHQERQAWQAYSREIASLIKFLQQEMLEPEDDFQTRFTTFLKQQAENAKIESLLYGSPVEGAEKEVSPADEEAVKEDFKEIGLNSYELIIPKYDEWFLVRNASMSGVVFRASYSAKRKVFRNIVIDERLYPFSIMLDKLPIFLLGTMTEEVPSEPSVETGDDSQAITSESRFEKLLKTRVLEKFKALVLSVEEENLEVLDAEETKIKVLKAKFRPSGASEDIEITFTYKNVSDEVTDLRVQTPLNEILVSDTFPLSEILERSKLIFERAKLEKERLEEEEKLDGENPE